MKLNKFIPAFAQPIAIFDLELGEVFNAELTALVESMRLSYTLGNTRTNRGGWRNEGNFFAVQNPLITQLRNACQSAAFEFLKECEVEISLQGLGLVFNGWANWNGIGHYNAPHRHLGADVCGCYYVHQPIDDSLHSGNVEFLDHRNVIPQQQRLGGPVFRSNIQLRPKAGELVVFPSFLTHWVPPNQSDEGRVVVAWNANLIRLGQGAVL